MALIPGDIAFYDMLTRLSTLVRSASSLLTDLCENPDQQATLVDLIRSEEQAADVLTHEIVLRLGTSFVPPLDATEIYELARALDSTIDIVEDASTLIEVFRLKELDEPTRQLAAIVLRCATVIEIAVEKLHDPNSLLPDISDAWRLEEEGDAIYGAAIESLFTQTSDTLDVMKRKELYDVLELAIDLSKDVAEVLTSIAVKRR